MINRFPEIVTEVSPAADKERKGPSPWVGIIIHHTDIGARDPAKIDEALWRKLFRGITGWLTAADSNSLSAHFHIGRFGECAQLGDPDSEICYHAGKSEYYHPMARKWLSGWNQYAIGIELLGDGNKGDYSEEQYAKLAKLCAACMRRYQTIDPRCITGHENVAPTRKVDPGKHFNWRKFFIYLFKELGGPPELVALKSLKDRLKA